ncbi:MAG: hypothetical protein M3280_09285 [Actinomycetota bacterium]|nr:hypothetical protein [Actinomycetota bacterium]
MVARVSWLGTLVACLVTVLILTGCDEADERVAKPDLKGEVDHSTVVQVDAASGRVSAVVPVGPDPLLLTKAAGQVWTVNLGDATLSRVDPSADSATSVNLGEAVGVASDGKNLWAAADGTTLVRIDGVTGAEERRLRLRRRPLFAPRDAGFLGFGRASIWLTVPELGRPEARHALWRIDPGTGRAIAKFPLRRDPLSPLVDGRYVWIVSLSENSLTRIDSRSTKATTIRVGAVPLALAAGAGSVWVGHELEREVWRLDPETTQPTAKIPIDGAIRGLAFGGGFVWVTTEGDLHSIDPATNEVTREIQLMSPSPDLGPIGVVYLDGSVWVSVE